MRRDDPLIDDGSEPEGDGECVDCGLPCAAGSRCPECEQELRDAEREDAWDARHDR